jgi:release factor glutamine methyltransferase
MASVAELLLQHQRLKGISDSAALDVELLLCFCLQKERSYFRAWPEAEVATDQEQLFKKLLNRRINGEPIAYLIGERGFWSLDLMVNTSTLIPRPETELLVEKALALLDNYNAATVLDLGTGTGAIALALASERSDWLIEATDVQPDAVALAQSNKKKYALDNVRIYESNWFESVTYDQFDLVISNPPYIALDDIHLAMGDVRFEPRSALVADKQGLADIERIISQVQTYLNNRGWLLFEHGYDQATAVRDLLLLAGFDQIFTEQDLAGVDRISGGQYRAGA